MGPGYHSAGGPQIQHRPIPEPSQSACCWSDDGVQAGGPPPPILAAIVVTPPEDVVSCATGKIVAGKM